MITAKGYCHATLKTTLCFFKAFHLGFFTMFKPQIFEGGIEVEIFCFHTSSLLVFELKTDTYNSSKTRHTLQCGY